MKRLKVLISCLTIVLLLNCGSSKDTATYTNETVTFYLDLNDRSNDTYKVEVLAPKLDATNSIFQFASTAPGTYQVMDVGRFVSNFTAFDKSGNIIETSKTSVNQYQLSQPENIAKIQYEIAETWDTPVDENKIYMMCGTSIENDHTLINGQAVFGYFKGKQSNSIQVKIEYPESWKIGTALQKNEQNYYIANSYDHIVDSPILIGDLTKATMEVEGTTVAIYTYSKTGLIKSQQILESMKNMLLSASGFLNGLPVKEYTFLFHFEDITNGAWEHSYSSEYVYKEDKWENLEKSILDVAAHEFFHVVTPLNIHSEIVGQFNFITPIPSNHLWLYEGTTEWASHMMLFRSGQKSLDDYFNTLRRKVYLNSNYYDPSISLVELAQTSYTPEGQKQYGNIYMKGALVAGLLDIKLLELSNGDRGLIDVVNELAKKYGPKKSFIDATFFDEFVDMTYPEIEGFFDAYVINSEDLPYKSYYEKLGITYDAEKFEFKINEDATEDQVKLRSKWMQPIVINKS